MKFFLRLVTLALFGTLFVSCTTSYDAYGKPRQSIDPATAAIGAVALGAIAYSVGKNKNKHHGHHHKKHRYPSHYGYGGGYGGGYRY